jgi:hypothetical protein
MKTKNYSKSLKSKFRYFHLLVIFGIFSCEESMPKKPQYAAIASQNAFVVSLSEWDSLELLVPQIGCNSCINLLIDNYKENGIKTKLLMFRVSREKDLTSVTKRCHP